MEPLILASASPRRRELLSAMGIDFEVCPTEADESTCLPAGRAVEELSRRKAEAARAARPGRWILAADTLVSLNEVILGKPVSPEDAARMLRLLSGNTHRVYTGITLVTPAGDFYSETDCSHVTFVPLDDEEIARYVASGEPLDKAGAYGIQGMAGQWVCRLEGSYFGVMGLPVHLVRLLLRKAGYFS